MENVRRIYVEKKTGYAVKAQELKEDLIGYLNMSGIEDVRMFIRYDVENISDEVFEQACRTVFSEPPVDILYRETIEIPANGRVFSVEYLPGPACRFCRTVRSVFKSGGAADYPYRSYLFDYRRSDRRRI